MNDPKIISIAFAVPPNHYTQREVFESLEYPSRFWPIFRGAEIDKRHFWIPMNRKITWQEATETYRQGAGVLTRKVIDECMHGHSPEAVKSVSFASCTGYECPSIIHKNFNEIGFAPGTFITPILGTGCEGGFPALKRAYDFTLATGQLSMAVSCEICSACHFPEDGTHPDETRDFELLRANAIFGDGAAAILVGYDDNPRHPYLLDFEVNYNPFNNDHLGFVWQDGRLRVLLSRDVPKIVPKVVHPALDSLLMRNHLQKKDIRWWIIHPGGKLVLDNIRDEFGLTEDDLALSRQVLRNYGNCSSASIGSVGKLLMSQDIQPGQRGLIISLGAGLAAGVTLFQFPEANIKKVPAEKATLFPLTTFPGPAPTDTMNISVGLGRVKIPLEISQIGRR